ncbi:hypothetical protein BSL78_15071 [Apostichopus japonicus]|uniref:NEDD8-conjugating enzyme Ubc12 n=1 Tax=Stichopus japonicus TaxID=307972 RepID=A0A2G8KJ79_STIJA|nr:hypothetical protein BSL78_15071 [Apostichopus japonicus]
MLNLYQLRQQKKRRRVGSHDAEFVDLFCTDINELNLPKTCKTEFPDGDDLLNFKLIIQPDEGYYKNGRFSFSFKVGPGYLMSHPRSNVKHREDWKTSTDDKFNHLWASVFILGTKSGGSLEQGSRRSSTIK